MIPRWLLRAWLVPTLVLMAMSCSEPPEADFNTTSQLNCALEPESGWVPGGVSYREIASWDGTGGDGFSDLWGSSRTADGDLVVFDAGNTRLIRLGPDLGLKQIIGRRGRGPGEFVYQRIVSGDWVTSTDSSIVVMSVGRVSEFDMSGEFLGLVTSEAPFPIPIRFMESTDLGVLYAIDDIDLKSGARAVQTWKLDAEGAHELLRADSMPTLPRHDGRLVRGEFASQGEPLWAASRKCVFISDGASSFLLRLDLATGDADTIYLPEIAIPERTEDDWESIERVRREARQLGISAGSRYMTPTARERWESMVVDPDGFVWLEPWRPASAGPERVMALVVDPSTGTTSWVEVPEFPDDFLTPQTFSVFLEGELGVISAHAYSTASQASEERE